MSKIKQLESKRLLKELEYIQSDLNYKMELVNEADSEFMKTLNFYLESHPKLKEMFDKKLNQKLEETFKRKQYESNFDLEESSQKELDVQTEVQIDDRKLKIKRLYREIVKATHPDKVKNEKLNELYLKATKYYNEDNFAGTYSICDELNIEFEVEEDEKNLITEEILNIKNRIQFIEKTLTWKWFNSDDVLRQKIMFEYLKVRLNN